MRYHGGFLFTPMSMRPLPAPCLQDALCLFWQEMREKVLISTQRDAHPQAASQLQSEPAGLTRFHTGRATHARRELKR